VVSRVRVLNVMLARDLARFKGQAVAICLVMACGVATFVMSLSTVHSLGASMDAYYDRSRFPDVFAQLKRAPLPLLGRIAEVAGVRTAEARISVEVNLDVPGLREPAVGRVVSLPDSGEPRLSAIHLRAGRLPEPWRNDEAVISEAFARAHGLGPGDTVTAIINGRLQLLRVVGVGLSPEFVYQVRPGDFLPDDKRFAVIWMRERALALAFDMDGAFNDLAVALMPGASESAVIAGIDGLTERYGGLGAYGRDEQTSHRYLTDEMSQLRTMALIPPTIFLSVSAFLVNIVMARQVRTQRSEIATLKAFGYSGREVAWHYTKFVLVLVLAGAALGTAFGAWLGASLTRMYSEFFRFPVFEYGLPVRVVALGAAITGGAALAGALASVRRAARLPPAEAMQPEPPPVYRPTLVERLGLEARFPPAVKMVLRRLERQPVRSLLSMLGISASVGVLVLGAFIGGALDELIDLEFSVIQRQDVTVVFNDPATARARFEVESMPGVVSAEAFRVVPARLRHGPRERREAVWGYPIDGSLRQFVDERRRPVRPPPEGVLLSDQLAKLLDAEPGDTITAEILEGQRPTVELRVAGIGGAFIGTSAVMSLEALSRLMGEGGAVSGALLDTDGTRTDPLYTALKRTPRVRSVTVKDAALVSLMDTLESNVLRMRLFNTLFACVIAFGVVYNTARIALAERAHELATLRVLGFRRGEISFILLAELAVLTVLAIPLGWAFGYGLAWTVSTAMSTETQRVPFVVTVPTFAFAALVVALAATASALVVRGRLDGLDLVEVLKTRA